MEDKIILLSGGADPVLVGHLNLIQDAAKYGRVVWALNSDTWVKHKKGYVFMKWEDRAAILRSIKGVSEVIKVEDTDGSICEVVESLKPDFFGHGGKPYDIPERALCDELGIELVWGLGGDIEFSSGDIVDCMINSLIDKIEPHFKT
jgi:glycerol-3-phosphate cytidylyltransferase-like family protein